MLGVLRDCAPASFGGPGVETSEGRAPAPPSARVGDPSPVDGDARAEHREREREAWAVLTAIPGLGPVTFAALLRRFGSGTAILAAAGSAGGEGKLLRAGPDEPLTLTHELARRIAQAVQEGPALLERIRTEGLTTITLEDETYPPRLLAVEMPPHVLFVRGSSGALASDRAVAVVGTRRPSEGGRLLAGRIAGAVARQGAAVVSGLAVGIDGAAHAAVVALGLPTVAVLGGGHARLCPRAHARLADAIVEAGGAVVSELPPETAPTAGTFPRRNRLISGLTDATVVVEAAVGSGALITASWALEQGRDCYLVPGSPGVPTSAGCLACLRECSGQARIVAGIPELLEDLELVRPETRDARLGRPGAKARAATALAPSPSAVLAEVGDAERAVAQRLLGGPATADQLVGATGLPIAAVLGTLTLLEMRGLVASAYGRYRPAGLLAT